MPCNAHKLAPVATQETGPRASANVTIMLVIKAQKRFYLVKIRVADSESGQAVIKRIRAKRDEVINQIGFSKWLPDLAWEQIIDTATVSTVNNPAPVAGRLLIGPCSSAPSTSKTSQCL